MTLPQRIALIVKRALALLHPCVYGELDLRGAFGGIADDLEKDMTIEKIAITPEAYEEVKQGKPARFETMLFNVVNGALKRAREATQAEMAKMMQQGGGLGGLFGK